MNPPLGAAAAARHPRAGFSSRKCNGRSARLRERVRKVRTLSIASASRSSRRSRFAPCRRTASARRPAPPRRDLRHPLRDLQSQVLCQFVNNLINQLTPFFFYPIGGYFVINGELSFGALVAVLAYKELASPLEGIARLIRTSRTSRSSTSRSSSNFSRRYARPCACCWTRARRRAAAGRK